MYLFEVGACSKHLLFQKTFLEQGIPEKRQFFLIILHNQFYSIYS